MPIELFTDVDVEVRALVVPEGGELPPEEELEAMEAAAVAEEEAAAAAAVAQHAEVQEFLADDEPEAETAATDEPEPAAEREAEPVAAEPESQQ